MDSDAMPALHVHNTHILQNANDELVSENMRPSGMKTICVHELWTGVCDVS